jgi:pyruvate,water dikinase
MVEQHPVVAGRTFVPPGKGPWDLETTHAARPMTPFAQAAFMNGFPKGFAEGTAR